MFQFLCPRLIEINLAGECLRRVKGIIRVLQPPQNAERRYRSLLVDLYIVNACKRDIIVIPEQLRDAFLHPVCFSKNIILI